ncbi:RelA/SpoT family protein [Thermaurantimonas aggregans]|uniref:RelA/SpoT family protein n=1 Tax=Thermaurantimonas aggregans TaxID=2173829 RepID=A0A401XK53_9FLAO|nr:bifunctional (p)ppGpp synthetase/guanosine-3',5'-bis(diphosphate) 3'-pyrophosphohydrolase [Thermaurantimonas aggregans]MCX8148524.1 bifunctional (p)ppGpp synthetase/guanosine-3',5'-bis(diphosphate) 3'-pyrophosphohydrolase [Thermaurantimonas aggregans]GCD77399.1 RelA/SpoT family protein [Thermaurantimonas aggregans]
MPAEVLQIDQNTEDKRKILNRYRALLRSCAGKLDNADKKLIRKAFNVAMDAHKGVRRKSGEPYILHPLEVAIIVSREIGLGPTSIACALLHDVVEDSEYTLEDIERLFDKTIAKIIDGLTKISFVSDMDISVQAENFRKMLLTISDDIRVILIKLADRLHNMRTMDDMPAHKQLKIASETLYLYAPLAGRLGLYNIKTELEDLSLKYTEPEVYAEIERKLRETKADDTRYLTQFSEKIRELLKNEGLDFTIKYRTKSIYSIRKKMRKQGIPFEEVYDKFAIRIILNSSPEREKADIWRVYSIITSHYKPSPERFRDWISAPKSNGYESLHTTVMGPDGHWIEVQIRSKRMDDIAERGYAAHWKYKEDASSDAHLEKLIEKIRQLLENPESNAVEFVNDFKTNLLSDEIFIFTPKGDLKRLPAGSTPLDFAFEIHTDIGLKTLGAKVNGKLVPLNYKLQSGDQVEIITSEKQKPKEEWLNHVVTSKAKTKIKSSLREEKRVLADQGREILSRKLSYIKIKPTEKVLNRMAQFFKLANTQELFYKVGSKIIDNEDIKEFAKEYNRGFMAYLRKKFGRSDSEDTQIKKTVQTEEDPKILVFGQNDEKLEYRMGKCCNPVPGDSVFGFLSSGSGITVHRYDCPNAITLQSNYANRIIKARWVAEQSGNFTAVLVIKGIDTMGLVNKVTQIISNDMNVNIKAINISGDAGIFSGEITLVVADKMHLTKIIEKLKKVEGVTSVTRK